MLLRYSLLSGKLSRADAPRRQFIVLIFSELAFIQGSFNNVQKQLDASHTFNNFVHLSSEIACGTSPRW